MVSKRIAEELKLLRGRFPDLALVEQGLWVRLPNYPVSLTLAGWNRRHADIVFQILDGYPAAPPYGIYVPTGLRFSGQLPDRYSDRAKIQPPFEGHWGMFSWTVDEWFPSADIHSGSNLVNWAVGFAERFRGGH